jgi:hypothetical protein
LWILLNRWNARLRGARPAAERSPAEAEVLRYRADLADVRGLAAAWAALVDADAAPVVEQLCRALTPGATVMVADMTTIGSRLPGSGDDRR